MVEVQQEDRRIERTRKALHGAFVELIFERRYEEIRVADIIERANVGRSTFYDHYRSKEEILERTMSHLLDILADAAAGKADADRLDFAVAHFWQQRRLARTIFAPPIDGLVRRWLGRMIGERLLSSGIGATAAQIASIKSAAAQIALLEAWLTAKIVASPAEVARSLARGS